MPTCKQCSTAVLMLARALAKPNSQQSPDTTEEVWHPGEELHSEQAKRCWICAKFQSWLEIEHHELYQKSHLKPIPMQFSVIGLMMLYQSNAGTIMFDMDIDVGLREAHTNSEDQDCCQFSLFLAPIQAFPRNAYIFPVRKTLRSKLALARKWIDQCQTKHTLCARGNRSWYPTRLLHIDRQTTKVRLIISQNHSPIGPYVTLSHRWEPFMRVKLDASTMAEMQNEVVTSVLSQAFQDAITITHHLGISYLWIDALCIKQDEDELDWKIESQYMDKVYSNAFLNLSATRSSTGTEPLISESRIGSLEPSKINVFNANRKDYYLLDNQIWKNEVDDAPLNQRGWVFQERYLARRILHFGSRQLAWECQEAEAMEAFPDGLPEFLSVQCMSKSRSYKPLQQSAHEHTETEARKFIGEYHRLVHHYSGCQLTRSEDRLVAFSGIPKSIQEGRKDDYVAGVWNQTLPYDLVWYRDDLEEENCSIQERSLRAPSWSWASVSGAVNFPDVLEAENETYIRNWSFVQPPTSRKTSSAQNISITLEGFLFPAKINWEDNGVSGFQIHGLQFHEEEFEVPRGPRIELDGPEEEARIFTQSGDIHWIPCFSTKKEIHGLLVNRISRFARFQRLGILQVRPVDLFRMHKLRDVDESGVDVRMTRNKRRRLDQDEKRVNSEDSRGQRLIEAMETMERVTITLV